MLEMEAGGQHLVLLAEKAVWWPAQRALLVADMHIGKAATFRSLGVPVPRGTTSATLRALGVLVERWQAARVVFLGDFLHAAEAHVPATLGALARWRTRHAGTALTLVRGNHDDRAGDPPPEWRIDSVDEPLRCGPLALAHHPDPVAGAYVLAGHVHPAAVLGGKAHDRLRLPCFHLGPEVGVLPAFGGFTGMHPIRRAAGDRVVVVADGAVAVLPAPPER